MIPGYEEPGHVLQQLRAFEHEKRSARSAAHLDAINAQKAVFEAALAEFPAADVEKAKRQMEFADVLTTVAPARVMRTNVDRWM
jgi:hypothetical protein